MRVRYFIWGMLWGWLALTCSLAMGAEPPAGDPAVTLEFAPAADLSDLRGLRVAIADVLLADASTGMTGRAGAQVKVSTKQIDPEGQSSTMRVELSKISQRMQGRDLVTVPPVPVALKLDRHARLLEVPVQETQAPGEILSQGGLPLQALAILCAVPQLPDKPVAPGATWTHEQTWTLPGMGDAKIQGTTVFVALNGDIACLRSDLRLTAPDFEADNPLLPGQKVTVHNLVVEITDLAQEYETPRSAVRKAEAKIQVTLEATSPDIVLPVKVIAAAQYGEPNA